MRTKMLLLIAAVLILAATPVMAQTPGGVSSGELKALGLVVGMGIASGLCGIGQGRAIAGAAEGVARNPGARAAIQFFLIIGLVFIESLAIYTLAVVFTR